MKDYQQKLLVATMMAALYSPLTSVLAAETIATPAANTWQEAQIWTTYQLSPYLRDSNLMVTVANGKATLTGTVNEEVSSELAKAIAAGVKGINDVDNQIEVDEAYGVTPTSDAAEASERGYAQLVDDATVTAAIKSKMLWSTLSDGITTDVDTVRGNVTLTGEVSDQTTKDALVKLAKNTRGVTAIDNQLTISKNIKSKPLKEDNETTASVFADGWITTKVKSTYMYSSNVDSDEIGVTTVNGIVSLDGQVSSGTERALAIELAKNIHGVKSVTATNLLF
jgi:hyperosmotically inducible periplasmic protein